MGGRRLSQQISRKDWDNREPRVPGRDERASREAVVVLAAHPSIETPIGRLGFLTAALNPSTAKVTFSAHRLLGGNDKPAESLAHAARVSSPVVCSFAAKG